MTVTEAILKNFETISSIPRGTKYEEKIRQWLIGWAHERSFQTRTDAIGNLVIYVPATAGYEDHPALILQGHMDMVWQKTPVSTHDFMRDPIQFVYEGDWLRANGTTLGADNGIGVAFMLTLVDDKSMAHPPLELLLTVEEEMGVTGADNLDPGLLTGKTLINVDSETEGVFTIGCAGGGSVNMTLPVNWQNTSTDDVIFELKVSGLQGGHSGEDINKQRANANKLITRVLDSLQREVPIRLAALKGGSARNAIPRDAEAVLACKRSEAELCGKKFSEILKTIQAEHAHTETELSILLTEKNGEPLRVVSVEETTCAIRLLLSLPYGVCAMSADVPGFIETSNNIGIMELKEEGLSIISNHRSSVFSRLVEITERVESIAWLAGAKTERTKMFPPWQPNMQSVLLKKCTEVYASVTGEKAKIELTHGGLECGLISDRCGGLDAISMGPTIRNLHSPDERLYIPSLARTWDFLAALLRSY
jgi:dipeptidase D